MLKDRIIYCIFFNLISNFVIQSKKQNDINYAFK